MSTTSNRIQDVPSFGTAFTMLSALSKYADQVSAAVLAGKVQAASVEGFIEELRSSYPQLRAMVLASLNDDDRETGEKMLRDLPEANDPVRCALVLDQSYSWVQCLLNADTFASQLRLTSLRLGLEEAAAEQEAEKHRQAKGSPEPKGMYV